MPQIGEDDRKGKKVKQHEGAVLIVDAKEVFWGTKINAHFSRIIQAPDGKNGYERFTTDTRTWLAIIANWDAKDISGIELLMKLRGTGQENSDVYYVIFISGATKEDLLHKSFWAFEEGVNDIIIKPYTINGINKKIEDLSGNIDRFKEIRGTIKSAETYLFQKNYDSVTEKLEEAKHSQDTNLFAHRILYCEGLLYEQTGDIKRAEQLYMKAMQAATHNLFAPVRETLVELYLNTDRFDKAKEQVDEAMAISPLNPRWKILNSKVLFAQKKGKEAKEVLQKVSEDHVFMKNEVNVMYEKIDQIPASVEEAVDFNTDNETATKFINKAQTLVGQGRFEDAIKNYNLAADFDAKNRKSYYTAIALATYKWHKSLKSGGKVADSEKRLRESFIYLLDSIRIDTSFTPAMRLLARMFEAEERSVDNVLDRREIGLIEYHIKNYFKIK